MRQAVGLQPDYTTRKPRAGALGWYKSGLPPEGQGRSKGSGETRADVCTSK